jgi:invasion protein IalB
MRRITIFAAWSLLTVSSALAQNENALAYTDWTKSCPTTDTKYICITEKRAHRRDGAFAAAVQLIESENEPKHIFRVILPLGTQIAPGTRLIIDQDSPANARYVNCLADCIADHEINADMIGKLKRAKQLAVQGIRSSGHPFSVVFPLTDFGRAHDRLSIDTRIFAEPSSNPKVGRWNDDTLQPHLRR